MSGDVARTGLAIVGQVAGFALGGPVGAAIGGFIGAAAGNALFPLDPVQGPRLGDLKVQTSSYGATVPQVYGTARLAGNVFWAADIRERKVSDVVGGKGGPSQEVETFFYDVDLAVGICEGPIIGIRRIFANGRVIYDASGSTIEATFASLENIATLAIYFGNETQVADPTIEADKGVGNVPGYRGLAYVVFNQLLLQDFGNAIPSFEFEVVANGNVVQHRRLTAAATAVPVGKTDTVPTDPTVYISSVEGGVIRRVIDSSTVDLYQLDGTRIGNDSRLEIDIAPNFAPVSAFGNASPRGRLFDGSWLYSFSGQSFGGGAVLLIEKFGVVISLAGLFGTRWLNSVAPCVDGRHFMVFTTDGVNLSSLRYDLVVWDGAGASIIRTGLSDDIGLVSASDSNGGGRVAILGGIGWAACLESDLVNVWYGQGFNPYELRQLRINSATGRLDLVSTLNYSNAFDVGGVNKYISLWADDGMCVATGGSVIFVFTRVPAITVTDPALSTWVDSICERATLTAGQRITSGLTELVQGYVIGQPSTARAALDQLASAYLFDAVESDDKLRFVPRSATPALTIGADALGAAEGDEAAPRLVTERAQESELPARVTVKYLAVGADYQVGAQSARRVTTGSRQSVELSLPIVMTDAKAAQLAESVLYQSWVARNRRTFATTRAYPQLEPTNVITVDDGREAATVRLTRRSEQGPVVQWEAVDVAASAFTPVNVGGSVTANQPLVLRGPTRLALMDLPPLRDADDDPGLYAAVAGYDSDWRGATVLRSSDSGFNFGPVGSQVNGAVIGLAATVLGNYTGINCFDEGNTVDVTLTVGQSLSSVSEAQIYEGANLALLGSELVQFRTASLVTGTTWRLSRLLRGRRGTERFQGTHVSGETFVLLSTATTLRLAMALTEIGRQQQYKAVSFGANAATAAVRSFTPTGQALLPYSVVHVTATRAANNDVLLRWVRRGRIANEWRDGADVPLGEASEAYEVEIWNGPNTAVLRTLTGITAQEVTYTAAQMLADFGSVQANLNLRIYQLSATMGRGIPFIGTLSTLRTDDVISALLMQFNSSLADTGQNALSAVMRAGSANYDTTNKVLGAASFNFTGSEMVSVANATQLDFGAGDFTIDFFGTRNLVASGTQNIVGKWNGGNAAEQCFKVSGNGFNPGGVTFTYRDSGGTQKTIATGNVLTAASTTFSHIAIERFGNTIRIYVDGIARASGTETGALRDASSYPLFIGAEAFGGSNQNFATLRMDQLRIARAAVYRGNNFTPPAAEYSF
jgi:hypothetical protein